MTGWMARTRGQAVCQSVLMWKNEAQCSLCAIGPAGDKPLRLVGGYDQTNQR